MKYTDIGENIRTYRKRLNLTQDQLADKVGVSWEMISRYERGESSPMNQIDKISKALNIGVQDLIEADSSNNEIPFFANIVDDFDISNTRIFYSCPTWILKLDSQSFALDSSLVGKCEEVIDKEGVLFISPSTELNFGDIVIYRKDSTLHCAKYKRHMHDVIGKVLMQEIVY